LTRAARATAAALGLVALAAAGARAQREAAGGPGAVTDAENRYRLEVPAGWQRAQAPAGSLAAWRARDGALMVVTRLDFPNRDAWRRKKPFFDQVERGVREESRSYRRIRQRRHRLGRVPAMDLEFSRASDSHPAVVMRFVFFRHYTLVLSLGAAGEDRRRALRAVAETFAPYFGD
jgi:hypothetical protein